MPASTIARQPKTMVLEVPIEYGNMLNLEDGLPQALNEAGRLGIQELPTLFEPLNKESIVINQQKVEL